MKKKNTLIITGANGYLSRYFSKALIKEYNLILWDIRFNKLFLDEIKRLSIKDNSFLYVENVDITKKIKIVNAISKIKKNKIKVYGLINCAGLNPQPDIINPDYFKNYKSFIKMWDSEIEISLKGYMSVIYEVFNILKQNNDSRIINFSSDLGIISPNQNIYIDKSIKPLIYSVSKHGVIGMTKYFSTLFSNYGVKVNSLCLGGVNNKKFNKKFIKKFSNLVPLNRMCEIDEIISPIKFLLDKNNGYMTGHSLVVDGGRTIW